MQVEGNSRIKAEEGVTKPWSPQFELEEASIECEKLDHSNSSVKCNEHSSQDGIKDVMKAKENNNEDLIPCRSRSLEEIKLTMGQEHRTPIMKKQESSSSNISEGSIKLPSNLVEDNNTTQATYYDRILAKFTTRKGQHDLTKQTLLKEETNHNLKILKDQQESIDWEFWTSVISDFDRVNRTERTKFRSHLSFGVPPQLRGKLWRIFSNSETDSDLVENEYRELLDKASPHEKLMRRDVSRAFPNLDFFKEKDGEGQEMLFNVIKAYSLFDQHVGYCQGLHFIVGCLLLHMPDEAAFCVLVKLMSHYGLRGHFTPQMETLHERMYQFNQLLQIHLPQVHRHLDAQGVLPSMYASQWFMTLFAYRCPLDLVYRVFDLLFVEGSNIILNFALALIKKNQQTILSLEFESLLDFFSSGIFDAYKDNAYAFVEDAYSFDIPSRLLAKLSKQHQIEAVKEAKIQSIEDGVKRENIKLQEQLKRLRQSYKILEMDHREVTQQVIHSKVSMASLDTENQQLKHELSVMKAEMEKLKSSVSHEHQEQFEELVKRNAQLIETNTTLEDKLSEIESELIEMKLKYAESENGYDVMKQMLSEVQKQNKSLNK